MHMGMNHRFPFDFAHSCLTFLRYLKSLGSRKSGSPARRLTVLPVFKWRGTFSTSHEPDNTSPKMLTC